jgi:hypothetical protein
MLQPLLGMLHWICLLHDPSRTRNIKATALPLVARHHVASVGVLQPLLDADSRYGSATQTVQEPARLQYSCVTAACSLCWLYCIEFVGMSPLKDYCIV